MTGDYILKLATHGMSALKQDENLAKGLNVSNGIITNDAVKSALGYTNSYN